jgi:hypothetical protein
MRVAKSPPVPFHDSIDIDTSHQIESGGNVHDIMTHTGFWILMVGVLTSIRIRTQACGDFPFWSTLFFFG